MQFCLIKFLQQKKYHQQIDLFVSQIGDNIIIKNYFIQQMGTLN